jgi:hypothetical protein
VNECASTNGGCGNNARCINTEGSRKCQCYPTHWGDGFTCIRKFCFREKLWIQFLDAHSIEHTVLITIRKEAKWYDVYANEYGWPVDVY